MKTEKLCRNAILMLMDVLAKKYDDAPRQPETFVPDGTTPVVPLSRGRFIPVAL